LAWTIEYADGIEKALRKLGRRDAAQILKYLDEIAALENPRTRGHALVGQLTGLWRYRVGDWRVVCRIEDHRLVVLVLKIGHRREVYR